MIDDDNWSLRPLQDMGSGCNIAYSSAASMNGSSGNYAAESLLSPTQRVTVFAGIPLCRPCYGRIVQQGNGGLPADEGFYLV